jgi:hypothetical protein
MSHLDNDDEDWLDMLPVTAFAGLLIVGFLYFIAKLLGV